MGYLTFFDMRAFNNHTEEELVRMLKKDSVEAFDELYFRYVSRLEMFSRVYIKDKSICEEVVQEVFIKLWEKKDSLDENKSIKAFLFQMVKNRMLNIFRSKVQELSLDNAMKLDFYSSNQIEEDIFFNELQERTDEIIDGLPEERKKIFRMSRIDGLKNEEISSHLNISRRTVEHHIYLALRTLKKKLSPIEAGLLGTLFLLIGII